MRSRGLARALMPSVLLTAAGLVALVIIYFWVPQAFAVALAIGGVIGAVVVLYEVRLTKRIAQAEFIRLLNDGFSGDDNVSALWKKLLLEESISRSDRHLISSYLTFFETLHILMGRGVVDFQLVDDLFRNRFYRAIGNQGIQSTALLSESDSFRNVYFLLEGWRKYLRSRHIRLPDGYYSYTSARMALDGYVFRPLAETDLDSLLHLQEQVRGRLDDDSWLRTNSDEVLRDCLRNQFVVGAMKENRLVAAGILLEAGEGIENIQYYLNKGPETIKASCNLKLVFVDPDTRGAGLARLTVELLEREAHQRGYRRMLCTIHPKNVPSQKLFGSMGYRRLKRVRTSYGTRDVFGFDLKSS